MSSIGTPIGRRERKRIETRNSLVEAALELFDERGFDAVTVVEISERADVDASTFFRHFGSKDAVLFEDFVRLTSEVAELIANHLDEPLLDAIFNSMEDLASSAPPDGHFEMLRARLIHSSPALQTQALAYRERLVRALEAAIGDRTGLDITNDIRPYIAATVFASSLEWYRARAAAAADGKTMADATDEVRQIVAAVWPEFDE